MAAPRMILLFGTIHMVFVHFYPFVVCQDNPADYFKREHSLMRPYTGSGASLPMWDMQGHTMITNNYVRLTPDRQSRQGAIWNKVPNRSPNWEIHIEFNVHGQGKTLFGDGFAVWYTKDRMQMGPVFGSKDYHTGLGIYFDTYSNHNGPHNHPHPYISAQINNGTMHYDHDRDGTHTEIAGCHSPFRNRDHETHVAIRYLGGRLAIMTDIDGKAEWKTCIDVDGIKLPTGYYFGISATTGQLADNHDIISVKTYELEGADKSVDYASLNPSADFFSPPRDHIDDPGGAFRGGWTMSLKNMFLLIFCCVLGFFVCLIVGVLIFQKRQEYNRKRFY
ncbi:vesicular integral-membrane protein VIP36-like [Patiria miniata]|uniref:L-type lectin-like domain-containing protein n=1 Tax=Patiria miniata TaxID=46514 RepID=A0A914ALT2_PATMI|nr:vesicular integral-membrane protein VIP36-like [Patiria miniata]